MANFKGHLLGAAIVGGGTAFYAFSTFGRENALPMAGASFIAVVIGGLLPDIDHDNSKPLKLLFSLLAILSPVALLPYWLKSHSPILKILLISLALYVAIRYVIPPIFKKFTVHRGIFHSIPFLLTAGILTALALHSFPLTFRLYIGASIALGALVHLLLDEMFSVDLSGARLKRSFGSALKLWSSSIWASILCYLVLFFSLYLLIWDLKDEYPSPFLQLQTWLSRLSNLISL